MHYTPIITNLNSLYKYALHTIFAGSICIFMLIPSLTVAQNLPKEHRPDTYIGTDSPDIIIKEDYPSGDRIMRVKPEKQKEEDCNKYTNGQYPIIIDLRPDISKYKK